jgi:hypothetical protein
MALMRSTRALAKTRLERREPRLAECAQILDIELPALHHTVTTAALLRVGERSSGDGKRCRAGDHGFPHDKSPFPGRPYAIVQSRDAQPSS